MRHFQKNPELEFVSIPGVGPLKAGVTLIGEEFAKYSPKFLMEVPEMKAAPVRKAAPRVLTEVPEYANGMPVESNQVSRGPTLLTEPAPIVPQEMPVQASVGDISDPDQILNEMSTDGMTVKRRPGRPRKNPISVPPPPPNPDDLF